LRQRSMGGHVSGSVLHQSIRKPLIMRE